MDQCPVIKETNTVQGVDYAFLGEAAAHPIAEEIAIPAAGPTAARYLPLLVLLLACCCAGTTNSIMGNNSTPILMAILCMFKGSFEYLHNIRDLSQADFHEEPIERDFARSKQCDSCFAQGRIGRPAANIGARTATATTAIKHNPPAL